MTDNLLTCHFLVINFDSFDPPCSLKRPGNVGEKEEEKTKTPSGEDDCGRFQSVKFSEQTRVFVPLRNLDCRAGLSEAFSSRASAS